MALTDVFCYLVADVIKVHIYGETFHQNTARHPHKPHILRSARHVRQHLPAYLNQNYHHQLTHVDNRWLAHANDAIEELTIQGNRIKSIHGGDFDGLTHLRSLKLRRNRLKMILGPAFNSVASLEELDLSRNHLKWFGKALFDEMRPVSYTHLTLPTILRV